MAENDLILAINNDPEVSRQLNDLDIGAGDAIDVTKAILSIIASPHYDASDKVVIAAEIVLDAI